jgi:glucose-1-phosphatase
MIKVFLFDFGGVIYEHPKEVIPVVLAKIYQKPLEMVLKEYGKYKNDYLMGKFATEKLIESLSSAFQDNISIKEVKILWLKYYSELAKPNADVLNIIKKLHENYKVYLFSNTTEMSNKHNSKTGIYNFFDGIFLSNEMGMKKPNEDIYRKVLSSVNCRPEECIFIDDDSQNLLPAERMGMTTVLFNILAESPHQLRKKLEKLNIKI